MPKHPDRVSVWEATPEQVLNEVINFSQIKKSDAFYDLGSGDGCVLIRAAETHGCKVTGLEITQNLINRTLQKAKKRGVEHLVTIKNKDMRKANYRKASIVYMYLPDGAVKKMFPILLKQLKKGSKIVTLGSTHVTGDYPQLKPFKTLHIEMPERFWKLRMWIV